MDKGDKIQKAELLRRMINAAEEACADMDYVAFDDVDTVQLDGFYTIDQLQLITSWMNKIQDTRDCP